jgi:Ni,Fe-hydrogenase III large subunit
LLPEALRLHIELGPATADVLGWGARLEAAEVEIGFNHVGLEERAERGGLDWEQALQLVEGLCGRCSQANALAFVQAAEAMGGLIVPPRAAYLRLVLAELERVISHLLNAADVLNALDMPDREAVLRDLRERTVHALSEWSGARIRPGLITYGGLTRNVDDGTCRALTLAVRHVERALRAQVNALIRSRDIVARLVGLGSISPEEVELAGLRGPVARASGIARDIRADFPTGAYEEEAVTVVAQRGGDAFSRLVVRLLESLESFRMIEQVMDDLPGGPVKARGSIDLRGGSGVGRAEGPRGEVFCWVRGGPDGVTGLHLSAGSYPTLGILPGLLRGQSLDDVRLLLLSVDLCLACAER